MVELQRNLETFTRNDIKVFAISPDSQDILHKFARKYSITYPLLSDKESQVIRTFGILNTNIPEDHGWFGIPFPGMYMISKDGDVFDKHFAANHAVRESVNDVLQESFGVEELERGKVQTVTTPYLTARAYFSSPTLRRAQLTLLTVEIELKEGIHVYGRPLPEGYIPIELSLEGQPELVLHRIDYPESAKMRFEVLDETLPVYSGRIKIRAHCRGMNKDEEKAFEVKASLHYQACSDEECYLPQTIEFTFPLKFLPHDWERIK